MQKLQGITGENNSDGLRLSQNTFPQSKKVLKRLFHLSPYNNICKIKAIAFYMHNTISMCKQVRLGPTLKCFCVRIDM